MSLFGTPQPQQTPSFFQPQSQQQPLFQQTPSIFTPQQQQPQQVQQQQQQQQLFLFTNDKVPASYSTKWSDLHPDSQKLLLQIEERILEYRDESQRLDQCSRLYDASVLNDGFELDASRIVQELGGISSSVDRQKAMLQELMTSVKDLLRNTEIAVRSFMMLRPRFIHSNPGAITSTTAAPGTTSNSSQPVNTSMMAVYDFYNGVPKKPSPFLQHTVSRFEKYLGECRQWIEEIEQLVLLNSDRNQDSHSLLQSLPKVMSNVHDFFVHVAAKVESIHQYIESMKLAYLADQRRRGESDNPFLEADRRETAKLEAAAKRVHPTLHLPAAPQPSAQGGALFSTPSAPGTSTPAQTSAPATSATGGGLFSTPFSAPSSTPSLFSTPSTSAPTSSLFGPSTAATPQTTNFGASSGSLFGSASTPSLFGNTASAFGTTASAGGALFSTPFASGTY
uniref:Nucleoporin p58/p45 n=1 Tax=Kalanchoe fedtschenkoi TaxID=63787 RepID=A0A7N0ZT47_KALFE